MSKMKKSQNASLRMLKIAQKHTNCNITWLWTLSGTCTGSSQESSAYAGNNWCGNNWCHGVGKIGVRYYEDRRASATQTVTFTTTSNRPSGSFTNTSVETSTVSLPPAAVFLPSPDASGLANSGDPPTPRMNWDYAAWLDGALGAGGDVAGTPATAGSIDLNGTGPGNPFAGTAADGQVSLKKVQTGTDQPGPLDMVASAGDAAAIAATGGAGAAAGSAAAGSAAGPCQYS